MQDSHARYRGLSAARRQDIILSLVLALLAICLRLAAGELTNDDAFITFRYARNLALGLGFVYNSGEHVIGTTTPLVTVLFAALYRLGFHDLPRLATVVDALADGLTAALMYRAARRLMWQPAWAVLASALFAISALSIHYAASGMDSSIFTLVSVAALLADAEDRMLPAGFLCAAAVVTRPEGWIVAGLVLGRRVIQTRSFPWRVATPTCALAFLWGTYATYWTGSPLPGSVAAKVGAYRAPPYGMLTQVIHALVSPGLALDYIPSPYGQGYFNVQMLVLFVTFFCLLFSLALSGRVLRVAGDLPDWWAFFAFAPCSLLFYSLVGIRGVEMFPWYLVPIVPFYFLGAVGVLKVLWRLLPPAGALATLLLVAWTLFGLDLQDNQGAIAMEPRGVDRSHEIAFLLAAKWIKPHLRFGDVVGLKEFGAFGYATGARILDIDGIVSPISRNYYPVTGQNSIPVQLIERVRPQWLVNLNTLMPRTLVTNPWFAHAYRLQTRLPVTTPSRGETWVDIYRLTTTRATLAPAANLTLRGLMQPRSVFSVWRSGT
jgi:hypothetical protein